MPVTERIMAPGDFSVRLRDDTPADVMQLIDWRRTASAGFAHIVIIPARRGFNPNTVASPLDVARYTGVILELNEFEIRGAGLWWWLEDDQGRGPLLETAVTNTADTLSNWITDLRPSSLTAGTVGAPSGSLTATYQWITNGAAIRSVCEQFTASSGSVVEAKIDAQGRLHANSISSLYSATTPLVSRRKGKPSLQADARLSASQLGQRISLREYLTKIRLAGPSEIGTASTSPTYYSLQAGDSVNRTVYAQAQDTPPGGEDSAAAALLANYGAQQAIRLELEAYDVGGDISVGQTILAYDPALGLFDISATAVELDGVLVHPVSLRIFAYSWPIRSGFTVWHRRQAVSTTSWLDLTPYVIFESGPTTVDVGALPKTLSNAGVGRPQISAPVEEGRWAEWTPALTQGGAVSSTNSYGRYRRIGSTIEFALLISATASGSAANPVGISLPIAAAGPQNLSVGQGHIYDSSAVVAYVVDAVIGNTASIMWFVHDTSTNNFFGAVPGITLANGDSLTISGTYEAAIT